MRHAVWRHTRRRSYSSGWRVQNFCGKIRSIGQYSPNSCQSYPRTIKSWRRKQLRCTQSSWMTTWMICSVVTRPGVAAAFQAVSPVQGWAANNHRSWKPSDNRRFGLRNQRNHQSRATWAILKGACHSQVQQPPHANQADAKVWQMNSSGRRLTDIGYVSPLRKLSPVLIDGIVRVGGRLQRAAISAAAKHPPILPGNHPVNGLIVKHHHLTEGHVGTNHVLASVRQKFWILKGLTTVTKVVGGCQRCRRWNARPGEEIMPPLPEARVTPGHATFTSVGIDYFGPILVKRGTSEVKRYGCIFTCLAVRVVHIEIAHDLSTDSFIQAFTRFVSRRGPPSVVFSDNGTNFKGAETDMKQALNVWNHDKIRHHLQSQGAEWKFNSAGASHAGCVWERMIRSTRKTLRNLLGNQLVDDFLRWWPKWRRFSTTAHSLATPTTPTIRRPRKLLLYDPTSVPPLWWPPKTTGTADAGNKLNTLPISSVNVGWKNTCRCWSWGKEGCEWAVISLWEISCW